MDMLVLGIMIGLFVGYVVGIIVASRPNEVKYNIKQMTKED